MKAIFQQAENRQNSNIIPAIILVLANILRYVTFNHWILM
jgi:hypothetical protein